MAPNEVECKACPPLLNSGLQNTAAAGFLPEFFERVLLLLQIACDIFVDEPCANTACQAISQTSCIFRKWADDIAAGVPLHR